MLYVTTRNNRDAFTAQRTLRENRGPDGGLFVPFRAPVFTREDMDALAEKSFNACVTDILNTLFKTKLTSREVDLCIGRYAVRLEKLGRRVIMGECWHNLDSQFSRMVVNLTGLLRSDKQADSVPGDWAMIGVRIAVLFGIFGELMRQGIASSEDRVDISLVSGDFSAPMSAWYARQWGLPIGNIICCCNENGNLWDFICHGQLRTDGVALKTALTDADVLVPVGLERLIHAFGGTEEVERYLDVVRRGGIYYADDKSLQKLRQGIYVTVSSERRILSAIPSIYRTHSYLLSPYSALAYAGLQDYRSRTGASRYALVLAEKSPDRDMNTVAAALGITVDELKRYNCTQGGIL